MTLQEQPPDDEGLSQSTVFDVLSSRRRRWVLRLLDEAGGSLDLTTLTERVAALEVGVPVDELPSQARKRVYVSLYQTHIPKLEDVGLVTYDSDTGLVRRTERATSIDPYLTDRTPDRDWAPYYLFLGVLGVSLLTAAQLRVEISTTMVTPVVLTTLLLLVGAQFYARSRNTRTLHEKLPGSQ